MKGRPREPVDDVLISWNKIDSVPGTWEEKFEEAFTSFSIEGAKTTKDPKMKLTAEIWEANCTDGVRQVQELGFIASKMGDYFEEQ